MSTQPAILVLADGQVFHGQAFGKIGTATGEICFNTGMTGYQEVFTDPSYTGQIIIMNNVHIGNYGVRNTDVESKSVKIRGLIGRNLEEKYSRLLANGNLNEYLIENNIVAIEGLDTRALVTLVRKTGAMNCIISSDNLDEKALKAQLAKVPSMDGLELASTVSTNEIYELGDPNSKIKVAVLDFGVKQNILQCMVDRGVHVRVHPAKTKFETLKAFQPTGYFLSNGPGDPAPMDYAIATIKEILKEKLKSDESKQKILNTIESLPQRESQIVKLTFGINSKPKTIKEISEELSLSQSYLRSRESRALYRIYRAYLFKVKNNA